MDSKKKAEELVNKYRIILMAEDTDCGNEILCTSIAIQNAHIAVDEILEFMDKFDIDLDLQYFWWHEVKNELKNS
jgi:hypothetical protein